MLHLVKFGGGGVAAHTGDGLRALKGAPISRGKRAPGHTAGGEVSTSPLVSPSQFSWSLPLFFLVCC